MKTKLLIEQHFHGCFGIDFNKASVDDVLYLSKEILKYGIGGIFPTLVTDSVENTKKAIAVIKEAAKRQTPDMAKIFGIHLEGIFINPEKKGIHNPKHFLQPTVENYKIIEDDFIKIVTLAPELVYIPSKCHSEGNNNLMPEESAQKYYKELSDTKNHCPQDDEFNLIDYLKSKNIKVQAGHCTGGDLTGCTGVTHLFNAMSGITHRGESTALSALTDDNIYTEIIADGVHVSDKALELVFKTKPQDKVILISDSLPCTEYQTQRGKEAERQSPLQKTNNCHSEGNINLMPEESIKNFNMDSSDSKYCCSRNDETTPSPVIEFPFAGETIYYDGTKATSKEGTIAGSTTLLPFIIKRLHNVGFFNQQYIENPYNYHNIDIDGHIEWDDDWNIINVYLP